MNWSEACSIVGYSWRTNSPPECIYTYFAYDKGKAIQCNTEQEAKKLSKNIEKVLTNKEEIDLYWDKQSEIENKSVEVFLNALREEYKHLPLEVYNLCYSKAYEDGHSSGYDGVASYMHRYVEFSESVMEICK